MALDEPQRLSKVMAARGLCSRREADVFIAAGQVRVDGVVVSELGSKVRPDAVIELDASAQRQQATLATVLLHKPPGWVSAQPEHGYRPAIELLVPANQDPNYPGPALRREHFDGLVVAGRLDIDSRGLLVFTQDGRIARQLIGENSAIDKEYHVTLEQPAVDAQLARLRHGLELDGRPLRPAEVSRLAPDRLRIVLREGRKRQIRRMCEAVGLHVVGLMRVRIGGVQLGRLAEGRWRFLRPGEQFDAPPAPRLPPRPGQRPPPRPSTRQAPRRP
jgi:23S rRNA pseudouridine2604 synthase